jgi:hypothetical protein
MEMKLSGALGGGSAAERECETCESYEKENSLLREQTE